MLEKLAVNHPSACCTWLKAPTIIMSSPKLMALTKYAGAATRIGATIASQPTPAVTQVNPVVARTIRSMAATTALKIESRRPLSSDSPPESVTPSISLFTRTSANR
jgi:hypothetical protein